MNENVENLTSNLKPMIMDLDEKMATLEEKKAIYEKIEHFLNYVHDDVNMVGIYADQELVIDNLTNINSNIDEYKASCYLIKSEDENVRSLPQYADAYNYLKRFIDYFANCKDVLSGEISELNKVCEDKKLKKKYYEIFTQEHPFVVDTTEFIQFMNDNVLDEQQKIGLLRYTIDSNMMVYREKNS